MRVESKGDPLKKSTSDAFKDQYEKILKEYKASYPKFPLKPTGMPISDFIKIMQRASDELGPNPGRNDLEF